MRKVLVTMVVVGLVASIGGWATYSAFSATAQSSGNRFEMGTVALGTNASGAWMYQVDDAAPGTTVTRCTKVTYTGDLAADVRLHLSPVAAVGSLVDLTITAGSGSPTFPACDGFVADAVVFDGTLKEFADDHGDYASGFQDAPGAATQWVANDAVVYQFSLTLRDDNAANGGSTALSTGDHTFTWEARNL